MLLVVTLIANTARVLAEYLAVIVNSRAILDLRQQMYAHVLKMPLSRFSENTSDTMSRFVQDMAEIFRGLNNFFQQGVAEPFKALGVLSIALAINWKLTLLLLIGAPIMVVMLRKLGGKIRRANRKLLIGYGQMLTRLENTLVGMRRGQGLHPRELRAPRTVQDRPPPAQAADQDGVHRGPVRPAG